MRCRRYAAPNFYYDKTRGLRPGLTPQPPRRGSYAGGAYVLTGPIN